MFYGEYFGLVLKSLDVDCLWSDLTWNRELDHGSDIVMDTTLYQSDLSHS